MRRPALRIALAAFLAGPAASTVAQALPPQRTLRAPAQHIVAFEPPTGWERSASPPSSRLLATWTHRDGARLNVAAEHVPPTITAALLFDDSKKSLEKQGWTITHVDRQGARVTVDATLDKGKRAARQLYLVEDGFAYVITVVAPIEQKDDRAREFDEAIGNLKLGAGDAPR